MTVAELIAILTTAPQDALVVCHGYEDGYNAITDVSSIRVAEHRPPGPSMFGTHKEFVAEHDPKYGYVPLAAVLIT
jgi:hypothetical protein